MDGVANLPDDPQPIGAVTGLQVGVHGQGRLELSDGHRLPQAEQFHAVPEHIQGASLVHLFPDAVQKNGFGGGAVAADQGFPRLGLGFPDPGRHVGRKQGARAVIAERVDGIV